MYFHFIKKFKCFIKKCVYKIYGTKNAKYILYNIVTNFLTDFIFFSFDYEDAGYQSADLIKMDILVNGNPVEELATIIHR